MKIAGVKVSSAAVAQLAMRLHKAGYLSLADHVGKAVDTNQKSLRFGAHELPTVLSVLEAPPDGLAELRGALMRHRQERIRRP
jgi:hypothetical protein